jgi:hypothetical protein
VPGEVVAVVPGVGWVVGALAVVAVVAEVPVDARAAAVDAVGPGMADTVVVGPASELGP